MYIWPICVSSHDAFNPRFENHQKKITIIVIAEGSRDGSAKKYANKGGIQMITNTTGIPTSHTHTCTHVQITLVNTAMSLIKSWSYRGHV